MAEEAREQAVWKQVEQQRRYRIYYLDYGQAVLLLNACRIVEDLYLALPRLERVPADAKVIEIYNDHNRRALGVIVAHATKPEMVAACRRILGIKVTSDDEADAIWILGLMKRPDCWPKPGPKKVKGKKRKAKPAKGKKEKTLF